MYTKNNPCSEENPTDADRLENMFCPSSSTEATDSPVAPGAVSGGGGGEAGAEGWAMGNTHPSTSQIAKMSEDTAHMSLWVDWGFTENGLFERLHQCQLESQGRAEEYIPDEKSGDVTEEEYVDADNIDPEWIEANGIGSEEQQDDGYGRGWFEFGGYLWKVAPWGRGGKKNGIAHYRYVLTTEGMTMMLRPDSHETVPNVWIEVGSIPLCRKGGLEPVWRDIQAMFQQEGIRIERDLLSRIDMYADFDCCHVSKFCRRFAEGRRVTRARGSAEYGIFEGGEITCEAHMAGREDTGFAIGAGIRLRCYDKRRELQKDPIKWSVFAEKYDGIPEVLTRIEFQLRRAELRDVVLFEKDDRECRVDGVETYFTLRSNIWRYLTRDWIRFTDDEVDAKNNHQARAKIWSIWELVQQACEFTAEAVGRTRRRVKVDSLAMVLQTLGCMFKGAQEERPNEIENLYDAVNWLLERAEGLDPNSVRRMMDKHRESIQMKIGGLLDGV